MTDAPTGLPQRARVALAVQRVVCFALSPLTTLAALVILRFRLRLRFAGTRELRRAYRSFRRTSKAPLLVCGNHLTMIDSALIAYALGSPLWYMLNFASLPWNVPDRNVFAAKPWQQALTYAYDAAGNRFTDRLLVTSSSTTSSTGGGTTTTPPPSTSGPDSTSPTATIVSPTSASTYSTNASSLTLSGTASDNVGVIQVRWQNDTMRLSGVASGLTNWTASVPLQAGSNSISILAFDTAGNIGTDAVTVTVSSTSTGSTGSTGCATTSTVSICTPTTETSFTTTQSSINMTGTAPSVVTRVVWENSANGARGVASGTTSWAITNIPLVAGSNLIEVTAYDSAGNPSTDRLFVTR